MTTSQTTNRDINVLVAFDAMRTFLQMQWEGDEKHSDLANLLSNVSRDVWANGQPLDIAQWSDWLDAVLSIRPELDQLKKVRLQLQEDHQEFLRALKIAPLEAQRKTLDKLRDKASQRPWHLGSNYFLSVLDAYEAMRAFLSAYWSRGGQSLDIGIVLDKLKHDEATPLIRHWEAWLNAINSAKAQADRQH